MSSSFLSFHRQSFHFDTEDTGPAYTQVQIQHPSRAAPGQNSTPGLHSLRMLTAMRHLRWHALLVDRAVLAVEGADSKKLLQGLTTADVDALEAGPLYTAFLSAQGRVLFDAFLVAGPGGSVLLDVEQQAVTGLAAHIKRYMLRSKATVRDASSEYQVVAAAGSSAAGAVANPPTAGSPCEGGVWVDPRLPSLLGYRVLHRREATRPAWLDGSAETSAALYAFQLSLLGVPCGARDLPPSEALPLESNLELLNAISFHKGCYLGQELTARTKFRGVVRKRLLPVVDAQRCPSHSSSNVGGAAAAETSMHAFSHLPYAERTLAERLLSASDTGQKQLPSSAHDESEPSDDEGTLRDPRGGKAATLRSFNTTLGIGMALCRLDALREGALLVAPHRPPLIPLKPTWWPDEVLKSPQ